MIFILFVIKKFSLSQLLFNFLYYFILKLFQLRALGGHTEQQLDLEASIFVARQGWSRPKVKKHCV